MKGNWNILSQQSGGTWTVEDFERAAYRLVTEQVLHASDRNARKAYHLIEDHYDDFVAVMKPLGIRLERNAHYRYIVALPAHGGGTSVTLDETLFLLLLRERYDEAARQGRIGEHGDVVLELPDLQEAYQALIERPMPDIGTLRTLVRTARRWGLVRLIDAEPHDAQPFHLCIRPAIVEILGEQWLQRLGRHHGGDDADDEPSDDNLAEADDASA